MLIKKKKIVLTQQTHYIFVDRYCCFKSAYLNSIWINDDCVFFYKYLHFVMAIRRLRANWEFEKRLNYTRGR